MSLVVWQASILDDDGDVQEGVTVTVTDAESGSVATLFADRAGVTPLLNPFQTNSDGFARFYVQEGRYHIAAVKGALTRTFLDVPLLEEPTNTLLVAASETGPAGQLDDVIVTDGVEVYRIEAHASNTSISGFDATGDNVRRTFYLVNPSSTGSLILLHDDSDSAAGNRILCPGNDSFYVPPNGSVKVWQDDVSAAWRII
jgi:hypothetical protein